MKPSKSQWWSRSVFLALAYTVLGAILFCGSAAWVASVAKHSPDTTIKSAGKTVAAVHPKQR